MPEQIIVDPKVADFIQSGDKIECNEEWFFIPRWFKKTGDNIFELHTADELPQHLKDAILIKNRLKQQTENDKRHQ